MERRFGIFVGPDQGLDGLYLIGGKSSWGNNTSVRLKDDLSGWDLFQEWDIGSKEQSRPVPIVYY